MNVFETIKLKHIEIKKHAEGAASLISMGNPLAGTENVYHVTPAPRSKQVIVIGGGVLGCEAAISAAIKGHRVMMMERSGCLGNQWSREFEPFEREEFDAFISWQNLMLEKLHVQVLLNTTADSELIGLYEPDAAIVALGTDGKLLDGLDTLSCKVVIARKGGYEEIREGFEAGLAV